jgi:hypothetical protein
LQGQIKKQGLKHQNVRDISPNILVTICDNMDVISMDWIKLLIAVCSMEQPPNCWFFPSIQGFHVQFFCLPFIGNLNWRPCDAARAITQRRNPNPTLNFANFLPQSERFASRIKSLTRGPGTRSCKIIM